MRRARVAKWAGIGVAVFALLAIGPAWLGVLLPSRTWQQLALVGLSALEVGYPVAVVAGALLGLGLVGYLAWARRDRRASPRAARWLMGLVATLLGLGCVEFGLSVASPRRVAVTSTVAMQPTLPAVYPEAADPGELRVVSLGESSAEGLHYEQWLSVGSIVAEELGRVRPGCRVVHEKVAHRGDTLEEQIGKLSRLRRAPDLIVLYCGHNELAARFSWAREVPHYHDTIASEIPAGPLGWVARGSRFVALVRAAEDRLRVADIPPPALRRPLVDVPNCTAAEIAERLALYRGGLAALAEHARHIGATLVVVVPPANDAGFEPSRSVLPAKTPRHERERFAEAFAAAGAIEARDPEAGLVSWRRLGDRFPTFAETRYRIGRLLARRGRVVEAAGHFAAARDHDGLPMRSLTSFQDACREVAGRHGLPLVDGPRLVGAASPTGLLDDHMFHDGMHPSLRGYVVLAQGVVDALASQEDRNWPAGVKPRRLGPATVGRGAGMVDVDWAVLCRRGAMFANQTASSRFDAETRWERGRRLVDAARRIEAGAAPDAMGLPGIGFAAADRGPDE